MVLVRCPVCDLDFYLTDNDLDTDVVKCPTCYSELCMLITKCPKCNSLFDIMEWDIEKEVMECPACGYKAGWEKKTGFDMRFPNIKMTAVITPPPGN